MFLDGRSTFRENPHMHRENMQTPWPGFKQEPFSCEAMMLTTTPTLLTLIYTIPIDQFITNIAEILAIYLVCKRQKKVQNLCFWFPCSICQIFIPVVFMFTTTCGQEYSWIRDIGPVFTNCQDLRVSASKEPSEPSQQKGNKGSFLLFAYASLHAAPWGILCN